MKQNYDNHTRWYIPHHVFFYGAMGLCFISSIYLFFHYPAHKWEWLAIAFVFFCLGWLSYMVRQHYALGNQNRIVRLEMRLRYYQLTQKSFEEKEYALSFGQIAALRFAPDEEFLPLLDRVLKENLSPDDIKKSINHWLPDEMRV